MNVDNSPNGVWGETPATKDVGAFKKMHFWRGVNRL